MTRTRRAGRGRSASRKRDQGGKRARAAWVSLAVVTAAAIGYAAASEPVERPEEMDVQEWSEGRVRVEVQNAGGVTHMARDATGVLRAAGFDVVDFGNYGGSFDPDRASEVIDRVGRTDYAQAVAAALGIDNVLSDPDPNLYVDVSVVLGREWVDPSVPATGAESASSRPIWDPRRWLQR